jgi:tripartite-type tricarboxylate transporter receptor subunit TctC
MSIKTKAAELDSSRRRIVRNIGTLAAGSLLQGVAGPLFAQNEPYPNKPVRILLGYPPGGSADVMARLIADNLRQGLRQSFIVDNRPGASGNIAAQQTVHAPADGYTLLFGNPAEMVINKLIMKDMGFDPDTDFVPVVRVFNIPLALVVPAKSPYKNLADLIAEARRNPRKITFASAGSGSPGHLAGEALALKGKAPMTHVPYKGAGPALTDVMGGHVDCYFAGLTAVVPHLKAGAIRVLALSSVNRSRLMPDIPTVAETLIPGFDFTLWGGLFASAKTPPDIVALLNREANQAYSRPEVQARMSSEQSEAVPNTPAQFDAFVKREAEKYRQIIKDIGYTPQ